MAQDIIHKNKFFNELTNISNIIILKIIKLHILYFLKLFFLEIMCKTGGL